MDTTELLADIRQVADIPTADPAELVTPEMEVFTDVGILKLATRELRGKITRLILSTKSDFLVASADFTVTVQGSKYRIPYRAIGSKLHNIRYNDGTNWLPIYPTQEGDILDNKTAGFYFKGPYIVLNLDVSSGTLRMYYYMRPSKLVTPASANTIVSNTLSTITVNGTVLPAFANGKKVDVVRSTSPYDVLATDLTISSQNSNSITFTPNVSSTADISAGDYLCLAEEAPVAPIPQELYDVLVQRCVVKILQIKGDMQGAAQAEADIRELESMYALAISPRSDIAHRKIKNRNLYGR